MMTSQAINALTQIIIPKMLSATIDNMVYYGRLILSTLVLEFRALQYDITVPAIPSDNICCNILLLKNSVNVTSDRYSLLYVFCLEI